MKHKGAVQKQKKLRAGSIARRLHLSAWTGQLACFLFIDAVLVCLCLGTETFFSPQGWVAAASDGRLYALLRWGMPLLIVEGALLLIDLLTGGREIRRKLQPLDEMAEAAQRLSRAGLDESSFHDLEEAIARISPAAEGARLRTGNKELAGLEQAVNGLMERMRAAYRQQSRFVSDASHELRTPIAVIQGYANLLSRWGTEDEKVLTESIEAIRGEADHMQRLVEQLLFLARGDSGRTKLTVVQLDLAALMGEVLEESEMIDSQHTYCLRAPEAVPASGDVDLLKQTARILVENAVKYTPAGGAIQLRAGVRAGVPFFTVQDEGAGIPADSVPHIFERFYRADSSRTRDTGGTGLGLSIAKWIVDRHGGWLEVLSREDIGTRISVFLPQKPADT